VLGVVKKPCSLNIHELGLRCLLVLHFNSKDSNVSCYIRHHYFSSFTQRRAQNMKPALTAILILASSIVALPLVRLEKRQDYGVSNTDGDKKPKKPKNLLGAVGAGATKPAGGANQSMDDLFNLFQDGKPQAPKPQAPNPAAHRQEQHEPEAPRPAPPRPQIAPPRPQIAPPRPNAAPAAPNMFNMNPYRNRIANLPAFGH
jgi:hypothetical protein